MAGTSGEQGVVLLIEDNEAHAELVLRSFKDLYPEYIICHVVDGQQALDFLFRKGEFQAPEKSPRPDLILLDLRLPKVDGLEVLNKVKTAPCFKHIPVVVLTSSDAENDLKRSYDCHANSYIVKPLEFKKFKKLIADLGSYWLGWNVPPRIGE